MKIPFEKFKEAVIGVMPAVANNITITAVEGEEKITVSAIKGSFEIFKEVDDAEDVDAMNIEVNAALLKSILSAFVGDDLYFDKEKEMIAIRTNVAERGRMMLPYVELGDAYKLDNKTGESYVQEVVIKHLPAYINCTTHALETGFNAMSGTDVKKSSYYIETDGEHVRVTTTDGHRVSVRSGAMGEVIGRFIVRGQELKSAISLIGDEVTLKMSKSREYVQFLGNGYVINIPLVDGEYFATEYIINRMEQDRMLSAVVNREELLSACKVCNVVDGKMIITIKDNKMFINSAGRMAQLENLYMDIEKTPSNKNVRVGFNVKYLMDALESLKGKRVDFHLSEPQGACEILTHVEEGQKEKPGKAIEVVLPVKI